MPKVMLLLLLMPCLAVAQDDAPSHFFTSEAATVSAGGKIFVSVKKYNPSEEELKNATSTSKNAPMTYLRLPVFATNISLYDKSFESRLYCFDQEGKLKWNKTIGFSEKSNASPLAEKDGFLYTGEAVKEGDKLSILKTDLNGKIIWQQSLDSLENVNDIAVHQGNVNILASFDHSKKVEHKDGTYSFHTYPIYFFIQLDPETGALLNKEYQMMGNYLSSINYGHPYINSDQSYYLHNADSAVFLSVADQRKATVVSENMTKSNRIQVLTAGPASNHYITVLTQGKNKQVYNLITDFYGQKKKYESELPVPYTDEPMRHLYIIRNAGDSIITFICGKRELVICTTDMEGKSSIYKQVNNLGGLTIGAGLHASRPYIITLEGRTKPGDTGSINVIYY